MKKTKILSVLLAGQLTSSAVIEKLFHHKNVLFDVLKIPLEFSSIYYKNHVFIKHRPIHLLT